MCSRAWRPPDLLLDLLLVRGLGKRVIVLPT
jgi:hypothetical protein